MTYTRTTLTTTVFLLALAAAVALSMHAISGALLPFDRAIYDELQYVPGGHIYEPIANALALGVVEYTLIFGAAAYAWHRGDRMLAASVLLILIARTLNTPMKELIDRPRPGVSEVLVRDPAAGLGFPSGHSSTVVLIYGYVAFVAARHAPRTIAASAVALALAVVALIGWDRIYDGAHWPSDVLGGWASGATLLIAAIALPPLVTQTRRSRATAAPSHSLDIPTHHL